MLGVGPIFSFLGFLEPLVSGLKSFVERFPDHAADDRDMVVVHGKVSSRFVGGPADELEERLAFEDFSGPC